jgi:hypothetical protein
VLPDGLNEFGIFLEKPVTPTEFVAGALGPKEKFRCDACHWLGKVPKTDLEKVARGC